MNDIDTESLIDKLVNDLKPVQSNWTAKKRTTLFLIINFCVLSPIILSFGAIRPTLYLELASISFALEVILFAITVICLSYFYFLSLVPGSIKAKSFKLSLVSLSLMLIIFIIKMLISQNAVTTTTHRSFCYIEIMVLSIVPLTQLFYFANKGLFTHYNWSYVLASLSSALIPAYIMHFMCQTSYTHILTFHMLPTLPILALGGYLFSRKLKN